MNSAIGEESEKIKCSETSFQEIEATGCPYFPCFSENNHCFENAVFSVMRELCDSYDGGDWSSLKLSNGAWYMALLDCESIFLKDGDGELHQMSGDGAGLAVTAYLVNHLSWMYQQEGQTDESIAAANHFSKLRDFYLQHRDAAAIWKVLD